MWWNSHQIVYEFTAQRYMKVNLSLLAIGLSLPIILIYSTKFNTYSILNIPGLLARNVTDHVYKKTIKKNLIK